MSMNAENSPNYLNPETVSHLNSLDLQARRIVEGYLAGLHRSPYHGFSVEFAQHREYVPGDDLRYVDWKVFGKTDRVYLKQYEEETNFSCYLVLDTSESMRYRSKDQPVSKLDYARFICAALSYLVIRQRDAIGLVTYDSEIQQILPASSNASQLQLIYQILNGIQPEKKTDSGRIFHEVAQRIQKRSLVIILSDLFDDAESLISGLKHLHHHKHDVSVLQIIDPAEQEFPFQDSTLFQGLEGMQDFLADPNSLRDAYREEFEQFNSRIHDMVHKMEIDISLIRTDEMLDRALSNFLHHRQKWAHMRT